jgi:uncharacterized RmlC-like cupin family protein
VEPDLSKYVLAGDNSRYAGASGAVVPVVTRAGHEPGGYVLSGRARIYFGEKFADYLDLAEGDWVFVPPFLPHVECNLDRSRPLTWMTARTPENIVVNLPQVDDGELPDWVERP